MLTREESARTAGLLTDNCPFAGSEFLVEAEKR